MLKASISLSNGVKAVGPYSPAIKLGDFVFLSGQLGISGETNQLISNDVSLQTKQVFENIKNILDKLDLTFDHIVKTTVFLADMADFPIVNEIYASYFNKPYPARSAFAVKELPLKALVEIECIVIDTKYSEDLIAESFRDDTSEIDCDNCLKK